MKNSLTISVILPVYNEEHNIEQTVTEAAQWLSRNPAIADYELMVVNDGSSDNSGRILEQLRTEIDKLVVIGYPVNKGYGGALMSGIQIAQHDWVLLMDSDGQFKMDSLNGMLAYTKDFDIVAGYRAQRQDNILRIWLGEMYTFLAGSFLRVRLRDINCGFKLFHKDYLDIEGINSHAGAFYTHIFINAHAKSARIKEIPIAHYPRRGGHQTGASLQVVKMAIGDFLQLLWQRTRR